MSKGGAPFGNTNSLKYDPKFIDDVDRYLKRSKDRSKKVLKQKNNDKGYLMYENKIQVKLPTIEGFSIFIGISRPTIVSWEKQYPDFRQALDKIRVEQKNRLISSGLSGDYNSTIAKLILSSDHGMRERVDNTTDDKPINNTFTDEQADRIAERVLARRNGSIGNTPSQEESN